MNFRIILTQLYINLSSQEYQIDVLNVSFNDWDYPVSSFTPFHFSFTVPLSIYGNNFEMLLTVHVEYSSQARIEPGQGSQWRRKWTTGRGGDPGQSDQYTHQIRYLSTRPGTL